MATLMPMDGAIQELLERPLEAVHKALPSMAEPLSIRNLGEQGWNALNGDLPWPLMVLKESALTNNIDLMASFCRDHGLDISPHGKTTMAPQLVQWQLAAGAWGVTAATATQAALFQTFGAPRIILANELLDPAGVRWAAQATVDDPNFELYCLVDSKEAVERLDSLLRSAIPSAPLPVLVELGVNGRRAGCRSRDEAMAVANAVGRSTRLVLAGVETFEGVIGADRADATVAEVLDFLNWVRAVAEDLMVADAFAGREECVVTAGGSAFPDLVAEVFGKGWMPPQSTRRILRSGCYVTHDHGLYASVSPFRDADRGRLMPALEIWGVVLSRPEPDLAILGFGKRDVPYDAGLPVPIGMWPPGGPADDPVPGLAVVGLNDQHAMVSIPEHASLSVGQLVGWGVSHPCTAFDKWGLIPLVDDDYGVIGAIRTFF
jgi:D-serine dehydratase